MPSLTPLRTPPLLLSQFLPPTPPLFPPLLPNLPLSPPLPPNPLRIGPTQGNQLGSHLPTSSQRLSRSLNRLHPQTASSSPHEDRVSVQRKVSIISFAIVYVDDLPFAFFRLDTPPKSPVNRQNTPVAKRDTKAVAPEIDESSTEEEGGSGSGEETSGSDEEMGDLTKEVSRYILRFFNRY